MTTEVDVGKRWADETIEWDFTDDKVSGWRVSAAQPPPGVLRLQ
jgi:hypothetical protein